MRAGIVFLLLFVPSGASCILPVCFWACFWGSLLIYVSLCVCQSKKKRMEDGDSHGGAQNDFAFYDNDLAWGDV